jgi:hypothetical protein
MKTFKLRNFTSRIGEILKDVEYNYSIGDSSGLLKIDLTMYNDIDEEEHFIEQMNKLYRLDEFTVYHGKYKFVYNRGTIIKIKMY